MILLCKMIKKLHFPTFIKYFYVFNLRNFLIKFYCLCLQKLTVECLIFHTILDNQMITHNEKIIGLYTKYKNDTYTNMRGYYVNRI